MSSELRVGLLGCGVVGRGVLKLARDNAQAIQSRLGRTVSIPRVFLRPDSPTRSLLDGVEIVADPAAIYQADDIDIVVELIGGTTTAGELIDAALRAGKPVVTANKALMAERAHELIPLATERDIDLYFEAAVGGGIPVIRTLRESLASDRVTAIRAILNGTSNYILSQMMELGWGFEQALSAAQREGFAEADPSLDVGGGDAAHKLAILATLAFGVRVELSDITIQGITEVGAADILFAKRFGYVFKPMAIAESFSDGSLSLRVHPALVRESSIIAHVTGALNTVYLTSESLGPSILTGPGAGSGPTAVSVLSDVIDVGRNLIANVGARVPSRAFPEERLVDASIRPAGERVAAFYLRLTVADLPGVLGDVTGILGRHQVSIAHLVQNAQESATGSGVEVVLLTHQAREADIESSLREISQLPHVTAPARRFRVEEL